jgi:hypothetical protein
MSTSPAIRLPREPYPGLRPFLDYEAPLLLGRGSQVQEVIKRLDGAHFVAVVGGSGCGKSSLIRAGVVPRLRGYGIPDAGAYWIPVICTPGTAIQPAAAVIGDRSAAARHQQTPVTRLSWKLSQALQPLETPELEAARREEIATVFRQGSGFARLVDAYYDELPRRGPEGRDARFLFVIDQFEELFHPNNDNSPDARLMVEAVIDHFFNPHERCFVVMTVRSEHLADCAAYLELPDAINKSLYLVRRLNEEELRDVIVGPAKYYLRLLQRGRNEGDAPLASDVTFDEMLIERLVADVASISADADHLPLLQHVLARTWEAACHREGVAEGGVPARVTWSDLERAVVPEWSGAATRLGEHDGINALHSSLANWAELTYRQHPQEERNQIDAVLRNLAFKDPNNGFYFQQRLYVDDPHLLPGISHPREQLKKLLAHGFLDRVNYMFWDDEDPDHVTLKVSHEAFIRGWERFRKLVDLEADRFEEFVAVLRKCALWRIERQPKLLLEASELERVEEAHLGSVFESADERKTWFRVLLQHHDGERLSNIEPDVDAFLAASRSRVEALEREKQEAVDRERVAKEAERAAIEAAREARQQQEIQRLEHEARLKRNEADLLRVRSAAERADAASKRTRLIAVAMGVGAVLFFMIAGFGMFFQNPTLEMISHFGKARSKAETQRPGGSLKQLSRLVDAANLVEMAKHGLTWGRDANRTLDDFDFFPPVSRLRATLADSSSEGLVNGNLRNLLTTTVWRSDTNPNTAGVDSVPYVREERVCSDGSPEGQKAAGAANPLATSGPEHGIFNAQPAGSRGKRNLVGSLLRKPDASRGIFIPTVAERDSELKLMDVVLREGDCVLAATVWSVPTYLEPNIVFDADFSHLAIAQKLGEQDYVNLYRLDWEHVHEGETAVASSEEARDEPRGQAPNRHLTRLSFLSVLADTDGSDKSAAVAAGAPTKAATLLRNEVEKLHQEAERGGRSPQNVANVQVVKSWKAASGFEVEVGGTAWRLFSETALPVSLTSGQERLWSRLQPPTGPGCIRLEKFLKSRQSQSQSQILQDGAACIHAHRGDSDSASGVAATEPSAKGEAVASERELLLVSIYPEDKLASTEHLDEDLPTPIASLTFDPVSLPRAGSSWLIGAKDNAYEGWLALETDQGRDVLGVPWSTKALKKLGCEVLQGAKTSATSADLCK